MRMNIKVNSRITVVVTEFENSYALHIRIEKESNPRKLGGAKGLVEFPKEEGLIKSLRTFLQAHSGVIHHYKRMENARK